ncbi:Ig-like domain-containing protein [Pendulispora brunnea]|uniref:Ig-like domain-containing protein n=1 Tax=Pendulispora brunnea TaxID=2905690 RepID=A0ABZ2KNI0_9BACT
MRKARGIGGWCKLAGSSCLIFAAISACSSDENPARPDSLRPGQIPKYDKVPPTVAWTSPLDGEENAWVRAPIRVTFSEPVILGDKPVQLTVDGQSVPVTTDYEEASYTLTIKPGHSLVGPAHASVDFGDIRDYEGNPLVRPPWRWSMDRWIAVGEVLEEPDGRPPVIAAGPGNEVAIAFAPLPSSSVPRARTVDPRHGIWREYRDIDEVSARDPLTLFISEMGRPTMVFTTELNEVAIVEWQDKFSWLPVMGGDDYVTIDQGKAFAARASDNVLFAAFDTPDADGGSHIVVKAQKWSDERPLGETVNDPATEKDARLQSLALDRVGIPYVSYRTTTGDGHVRVWSKDRWLPVGPAVNPSNENAEITQVAVNDAGTPYALVQLSDRYLPRQRTVVMSFDGSHWVECGPPLTTNKIEGGTFFAPTRGDRFLAYLPSWQPGKGYHHLFEASGAGSLEIPFPDLSANGPGNATVDPNGIPVVTWRENNRNVRVARLNR